MIYIKQLFLSICKQLCLCLGETDPVDGAIVEWYDDEKEMVEAWVKEIIRSDCDIITGYNIFYFDENYIQIMVIQIVSVL